MKKIHVAAAFLCLLLLMQLLPLDARPGEIRAKVGKAQEKGIGERTWPTHRSLLNHVPARIEDEGDIASSDLVSKGTGSGSDPYIIEEWDINGSGLGYCLYIGNVTSHFVVRNCFFHHASGTTDYRNYNSGLILYDTENGKVENNTFLANEGNGIRMMNYLSGTLITNIEVCYNTISDSGGYGIMLSWSDKVSDNSVHHNNFFENNDGGTQAYDYGTGNEFDHAGGGNYWSDYESRYPGASNDGHVWSAPYALSGSTASKDRYPLVAPVDVTPPSIIDLTSPNATTGDPLTFRANVTDQFNVTNVSVEYWYDHDVNSSLNQSLSFNGTEWCLNISVSRRHNELRYVIYALDQAENLAFTPESKLTIVDNDRPEILGADHPREVDVCSDITITGEVEDNIGVQEVWLNYTLPSGGKDNISMENSGRGENWTCIIPGQKTVGKVQFNLLARDLEGNWNRSRDYNITITDDTPPVISNLIYPAEVNTSREIDVLAEVRDEAGISRVNLIYEFRDEAAENVSMEPGQGDNYSYTLPGFDEEGELAFRIRALDVNNNRATGTEHVISVIRPVIDNRGPEILMDPMPSQIEMNESLTVRTKAEDGGGVAQVYLNYSDVGGTSNNVSMAAAGSYHFTYEIPGQGAEGTLYIFVIAVDNLGNWNSTELISIQVIETGEGDEGEEPGDTTPPRVNSNYPSDNSAGIALDTKVKIGFSEPMNTTGTEGNVTIAPPTGFETEWKANDTVLEISFAADLDHNAAYAVKLSGDFTDKAGNNLESSFSLTFVTVDKDENPIKPDVRLSVSISLNKYGPAQGETITIFVSVENNGKDAATDIPVTLLDGERKIGETTLPLIGPGKSTMINFLWTVREHQALFITVDDETYPVQMRSPVDGETEDEEEEEREGFLDSLGSNYLLLILVLIILTAVMVAYKKLAGKEEEGEDDFAALDLLDERKEQRPAGAVRGYGTAPGPVRSRQNITGGAVKPRPKPSPPVVRKTGPKRDIRKKRPEIIVKKEETPVPKGGEDTFLADIDANDIDDLESILDREFESVEEGARGVKIDRGELNKIHIICPKCKARIAVKRTDERYIFIECDSCKYMGKIRNPFISGNGPKNG